jgi:FkbM family methyltransferase
VGLSIHGFSVRGLVLLPTFQWRSGSRREDITLAIREKEHLTMPSKSGLTERIRSSYDQATGIFFEGNWLKSFAYFGIALLQSKRPLHVSVRSRRVLVRPNTPDFSVARDCFDGEYKAAIEAAQPARYNFVIDAGGYIGTTAIAFAEAFPNARIITLEPSRDNFEILRQNVRNYPNVIPLNQALGASGGVITLKARHTGEWGYTTVEWPADCQAPRFVDNVEVTTIPTLLSEFECEGIDLLKLDIEGAEFDLLRSSPGWLSKTRVVVAELHDRIVPGCRKVFDEATLGRKQMGRGRVLFSVAQVSE